MAVLRALGEPLERAEDAWDALARPVSHATVWIAWDGELHPPFSREIRVEGRSDSGETWSALVRPGEALRCPFGVHDVHWAGGHAWIIAAPRRAYGDAERAWGLFAPLYAIFEEGCEDLGHFGTLRAAAAATRAHGGRYFATLPLLPTLADAPTREPSPYAPSSRLAWNELYLDLRALPEAQGQTSLPNVDAYVDWDAEADARFALLRDFAARCSDDALDVWRQAHPLVEAYARHRAARAYGGDEAMVRALVYAQWRAETQLANIDGLYLDLPLGVHHEGFDVAHFGDLFVEGCSAGAPPDPLFAGGQNWGFPPMHPEHERASGYAYLRACLEHHMRVADVLRIDHVAWLHRLYWIPQHAAPTDGAYVNHPHPEELYALLSLLSHRHQCRIIGEDLGTVPDAVRHAMGEHNLWRTWVQQLFAHGGGWDAPPDAAAVTVNTHDLPTFAGWWTMGDIDEWVALGLYDEARADHEKQARGHVLAALRRAAQAGEDASPQQIVERLLPLLASGPGQLLLITLEDLMGEVRPQNIPGTHRERPNWRGRARRSLAVLGEQAPLFAEIGSIR